MCFRIIGNRESAEEAAQDVFINCFKNIRRLENPEKFTGWLLRIAYNKSIDYVRRKKVPTVEWSEKEHTKPNLIEKKEDQESELQMYFTPLKEVEKAIIALYYQEDMTTKEIGETLDISRSKVKILLFRARQKIKTYLDKRKIRNNESSN